jgi:hypothetical protein
MARQDTIAGTVDSTKAVLPYENGLCFLGLVLPWRPW